MSTVLKGTNPMKTVFGYASVRDEHGEEMHKSKGNAIWFDDAIEKIGADPMRWMYSRQNPVNDLKFGYKGAEEIKRKLLTLYNCFTFFNTYVDKKDFPKKELKSNNILDQWIISRLNNVIEKATKNLDEYNPGTAVLAIEDFFISDLSLWYVRRSRKRFHQGAGQREETIKALYYILLNLTKLIAPIMPFFAEEMYGKLKTSNMPESVHLCDWPKPGKTNDKLEEKMAQVRDVVTLALAQRAEAGIKVRQPLAELKIKDKLDKELLELIKKEVNVKKITFGKEIKLDTKITQQLKKEGEYREMVRNARDLRKELSLTPNVIVYGISSTSSTVTDEDFLKEVGAKKGKKVEKESEMDVDIKKEIKLSKDKKDYIGIKK